MLERNKSSDSSIEPKASLHDQFTEAEKELIDNIIKELDTDDAKELEFCKTKLVLAEQEIITLNAKLKKALHQLQLKDEASPNMLVHKQMIDLRNKLEASEARFVKESKGMVKPDGKWVPPSSDAHSKVEVVVEKVPSSPMSDVGLRRRSVHSYQAGAKLSLFPARASFSLYEKDADDDRNQCIKMDVCGIL